MQEQEKKDKKKKKIKGGKESKEKEKKTRVKNSGETWCLLDSVNKKVPYPGIEPGPPGWKPGILTI